MTTHLLEEAEKAERIGILHAGRMVAVGHQLNCAAILVAESGDRDLANRTGIQVVWPIDPLRQILQLEQLSDTGANVAELVATADQ